MSETESVEIYAETSSELLEFLELTEDYAEFDVSSAFVEKRGSDRFYTFDLDRKGSHDTARPAPDKINDLSDWCSPDIIISRDGEPIITVETTYHTLTYNNIAQRIPRQVKAASEGVPSLIFQKYTENEDEDYLSWFARSFVKATEIHETSCLPVLFSTSTHDEKRRQLTEACNGYIAGRTPSVISDIRSDVDEIADNYDPETVLKTKNGRRRSWIRSRDDEVVCIVGANPDAQGWKTKGTGNMDPYPGLVKMSELLFCYNDQGTRTKSLTTYFRNLPRDFWWFEENEDELYYRLVKEFSDEVFYSGEYDI